MRRDGFRYPSMTPLVATVRVLSSLNRTRKPVGTTPRGHTARTYRRFRQTPTMSVAQHRRGKKAKSPVSHPAALLFDLIRNPRAYAFLTSLLLAPVATRDEYP